MKGVTTLKTATPETASDGQYRASVREKKRLGHRHKRLFPNRKIWLLGCAFTFCSSRDKPSASEKLENHASCAA
jgi:hypothetical protein